MSLSTNVSKAPYNPTFRATTVAKKCTSSSSCRHFYLDPLMIIGPIFSVSYFFHDWFFQIIYFFQKQKTVFEMREIPDRSRIRLCVRVSDPISDLCKVQVVDMLSRVNESRSLSPLPCTGNNQNLRQSKKVAELILQLASHDVGWEINSWCN